MKSHSVSCLILAGGESKRMNHVDKGLVQFNSLPLIEHVINALQNQVDDFVISANRNFEQYQLFSSTVIPDNDEKHGPLSGIAAALPACKHEQVLVVPCDMPYLPNNLLSTLLTNFKHSNIAIIEVHERQQLVFLMNKSLLPSLQEHLSSGQYKLMQWIKAHSPTIVNCNDMANAFKNINSMHELNQL